MSDYRKPQLLTLLILVTLASASFANDPNELIKRITFEQGVMTPSWRPQRPAAIKPTWAAGLTLRSPIHTNTRRGRISDIFRRYVRGQQGIPFSEGQRTFLAGAIDIGLDRIGSGRLTAEYRREDPNHSVVILYAVSREDAEHMAKAYLRFAMEHHHRKIEQCRSNIQQATEKIASTKKRIPELEEAVATNQQAMTELKKSVPYRTTEEAMQAIGELDRMLNTIEIEIAGIRARIEAIQKYQDDVKAPLAIKRNCPVLFIEESIALQGAEARRRTAGRLRHQANTFIDLSQALPILETERQNRTVDLPRFEEHLARTQRELAHAKEREPKVLDHKAFIYRLAQ